MSIRESIKSILRVVLPAYRIGLRLEQSGAHSWKSVPKPMLTPEVQLAEHCNLNCAYCDHFSPIVQPEFLDTESFSRDGFARAISVRETGHEDFSLEYKIFEGLILMTRT